MDCDLYPYFSWSVENSTCPSRNLQSRRVQADILKLTEIVVMQVLFLLICKGSENVMQFFPCLYVLGLGIS